MYSSSFQTLRSSARRLRLAALVILTALLGAAFASTAGATELHTQIVNGTNASIAAMPYMAFIDGEFPDGTGESCSGTVVAPRVILTAAHCVIDLSTGKPYPVADLDVTTGTANIAGSGGQDSTVARAVVNPGFHAPSQNDDSALLILTHAVTAPAITLATTAPADGTEGIDAGWGETSGTALDAPTVLREDTADVLDPDACSDAWGTTFDPTSQLCTENDGLSSGACRGDSGGPLTAQVNGQTVEIGLAIYVATGCATDQPDVYTRADAIVGWVNSVIATIPAPATTTAAVATVASAPGPLLDVAANAAFTGQHTLANDHHQG